MSILTKLFIVLQLVASLALSVLVVVAFKQQEPYKARLEVAEKNYLAGQAALVREQNNSKALASQISEINKTMTSETGALARQIEAGRTENANLRIQNDTLESKNTQLQNTVTNLTATVTSQKDQLAAKDKELAEVRPQLTDLIAKNSELNRVNNDLTTQQKLAEQAIRKLQEALALASETNKPGAAAPADGKSVLATIQAPVQINGKINGVATNNGRTYVTLGLGTRDGVKNETLFTVYRGNTYVGDAVVKRVTVDESVAVITLLKAGESVKEGDLVLSGTAN